MRKLYKALVACTLSVTCVATSWAIDPPTTKAGAPQDGQQMVLVSALVPTGYMSRTSWDGAIYFDGQSINPNNAFTVQKNENGTWSFFYPQGNGNRNYVGMFAGSGNLNAHEFTEDDDYIPTWTVEAGSQTGYYGLRANEGNASDFIGLLLHLNAGAQYFVISEPVNGGSWYPDYAGGYVEPIEGYEGAVDDYDRPIDENGRALMNDHTSENWMFLALEDVDSYYTAYKAYAALQQLEDDYLDLDGYATGFKATYDAALAIYSQPDFDGTVVLDMVNLKVKLYEEIVAADELDADALLAIAITTAKEAFDTKTSAEDVTAAIEALQSAVKLFKQGGGDLTSFGQNMSFEDLSSQSGNQTSSVAGAPTGWNVYINGQQVTTADEVRANGVTAWHGINNDAEGDDMDGMYAFGIWNGSIPTYEISQTIDGLENGTYEVTAGLMVGANGNGSRRTTQRIFGNLNATYFAYEDEYDTDELAIDEVPAYQGNVEITTDRMLSPMTVRAYVYDGKLTFGVRTDGNIKASLRTSGNGAGGDGWFKVDNFHIQSLGYIGEDAANVANHFINAYQTLNGEPMPATLQTEINAVLNEHKDDVSPTLPADQINAIITTLYGKLAEVQAAVKAYQKLEEAIENAYNKLDEYAEYKGYKTFEQIIMDIEDNYIKGVYDLEGVETAIKALAEAEQECAKSGIMEGEYVYIIQNPSFEDLSNGNSGGNASGVENPPAGWNLYINGELMNTASNINAAGVTAWCAPNFGDNISGSGLEDGDGNPITRQPVEGEYLWGIWTEYVPEVELSQSFTGIPAGTYVLTANVMVQNNWAGNNITTQRIFANDFVQFWGEEGTYELNMPAEVRAALALDEANPEAELKYVNYAGYTCESGDRTTDLLKPMELRFGLGEDGDLTIGFRTNGMDQNGFTHSGEEGERAVSGAGWFKVDNFRLYFESPVIPTAIDGVQNARTEIVGRQYFTADGAQIHAPQRGITIVKNIMSDGSVKVTKVRK